MRAVIFDFDGVIVDSERHWMGLDNDFFPNVAPGYTQRHAQNMMGLGRKPGFEYLVSSLGMPLSYEEYCGRLEEDVRVIYAEKAQLLPGVRNLIVGLHEEKIPLGIASSSRRKWIDPAIERLGIARYFSTVIAAEDIDERTKPLPDSYLLAAARLTTNPSQCLAIEDSKHGIAAAKAAGMACIGLRTTMSDTQDLSAADSIIEGFTGIDVAFLRTVSA